MSKYLGLIFDNSLSFEPHINNLARKLSKAVGILSKVKVYLSTSALCSLYYALFHCHVQYGIITLSSTYKTYLKKLATLQNKAVKIVGNGTWNDRATPYYAKLKILKLQDLVKLETAAFVYNYKSGQLPPTFQNYFTALNNRGGVEDTRLEAKAKAKDLTFEAKAKAKDFKSKSVLEAKDVLEDSTSA